MRIDPAPSPSVSAKALPRASRSREAGAADSKVHAGAQTSAVTVPAGRDEATLEIGDRRVRLTNLGKVFWPGDASGPARTKRDLLQYYADIAPVLLPHIEHRAMVMKRYPNGIDGKFFFMKRAPSPRPDWVATCTIDHASGNRIDFPVVDDVATLLWIVNLGCIDLNPWYARCGDVDRPDYLHFDLDPGDATFAQVVESAFILHEALDAMEMPNYVKTSGSKGLHVYVPTAFGPTQKHVWLVAKALARELATRHPRLMTAEYRIAKRPKGRVLIDYNQNAWGRTLASVYSVRPRAGATVSTPLGWDELAAGVTINDFHMGNVPKRVQARGDLFAPLLPDASPRVDLTRFS
jgi:bifunctional non-homologous end joining protein LigD